VDVVTSAPTRPYTARGPGTPAEVWRHRLEPDAHAPLTLDGVRRVVVVGAHPDDESLGADGLVARALGVDATARHRLRLVDGDLERDVERLTQTLVADVHRRFETRPIPPLRAEYRDRDVEIRVHAGSWPDHER
jgi:hypothetical protein